jgi:hypothetical protein
MFATFGQVYKTFYQGYLLSFYGMYCNKKFFTQDDSNTMEWQYITVVKSFITLAPGTYAIKQHRGKLPW